MSDMKVGALKKIQDKARFDMDNYGQNFGGGQGKFSEYGSSEESAGKSALGGYQSGKAGMELLSEDAVMRVLEKRNKASHA